MRAFKIVLGVVFALVIIGGPAACLVGGGVGESATRSALVEPSIGRSSGASIYPSPSYCSVAGVSRDGTCDYPSYNPVRYFDERPPGVERFLLLGSTDYSDPGNATTSFLMVFFGLCALVSGAIVAARAKRYLWATGLVATGLGLFLAGQILWNGGESKQWVAGFAFLALNVAVLLGLGFIAFRGAVSRRRLTLGVAGALVMTTVLLQSAVFYNLIGTPDDSGVYSTSSSQEIRPTGTVIE